MPLACAKLAWDRSLEKENRKPHHHRAYLLRDRDPRSDVTALAAQSRTPGEVFVAAAEGGAQQGERGVGGASAREPE
jgi:hypothetical protein